MFALQVFMFSFKLVTACSMLSVRLVGTYTLMVLAEKQVLTPKQVGLS